MSSKEKLLLGLILFFLLTLFFPKPAIFTIVAIAVLVLYSLFFSSWQEKIAVFKQRRHLQGMVLFFLLIVVSVLLSDNKNKAFSFLDPRLALFYFPVSIGTLVLDKSFRNKVLLGFAFLTTAVALFCLGYGVYRSHFLEYTYMLYNDSLTEVLGQQSIYIALLVNFSIYIFARHILFTTARGKGWAVASTLFLFCISYLLASRMMMGTLYLVTIGFAIYYMIRQRRVFVTAAVMVFLVAGGVLSIWMFPQTLNRFRELANTKYDFSSMGKESHFNMPLDSTQWNGANFRLAAWNCGWELFRENPVMGVHIGDKRDRLFEVYKEKNFLFAIKTNKNVHNNYLDILYSLGITGFLVFLAGWILLPLLTALRNSDGLAALLIITFATAWITENYFDRNLGGMLTGFFIPFLLTVYAEDRES